MYHSLSIGFFATLIAFGRSLRIEGKTSALIIMEEPLLLHPMQSVFLRLPYKHG